jgi:hypothetical protein
MMIMMVMMMITMDEWVNVCNIEEPMNEPDLSTELAREQAIYTGPLCAQ